MRLRQWLGGLNLAATLVLLASLFIFVNWIATRRYARADLSQTKIATLSDKTRQVLSQIKEPLRIVVFYQPTHRLYEFARDLLTEYEALSPKVSVEYVDPEQDIARAQQLAEQLQIERINLVVVESGGRRKYLSDTDLAEYNYESLEETGRPEIKQFIGEDALTSAIVNVTQSTQPLVWFTTGHGEHAFDNPDSAGIAGFKTFLERENVTLQAVNLLERADTPPELAAIVIAGPTRRFSEPELLVLQGYLERGGRLLALIDPQRDTNLDSLLWRWGADLGLDVVVDPSLAKIPGLSPANLIIRTYTQHPIVEKMETLVTNFPYTRSVRPAGENSEQRKSTALAMTDAAGWGETTPTNTRFEFNEGQDVPGPVSIAVAVEQQEPATRLVVIGDADFVTNAGLGSAGNLDFALAAFNWLAHREQLIGIGPKPLESIKLTLSTAQLRGIFWFSFAILPALFALLGAAVWWTRRA